MNVIEYDLSGIKPQKNNKSKSLKYIKHLHKIIKDLEIELNEKKEAIKYLEGIKNYDIGELLSTNFFLKQELRENEEENEQLKERWNKLKEYLNKQKENFKKMLKTDYAGSEMLGKLRFTDSVLKTMKNLEKGINI